MKKEKLLPAPCRVSLPAAVILIIFLCSPGAAWPQGLEEFRPVLWRYLELLDSFGPRNPGGEGHLKARQLIREVGKKYADRVEEHRFLFSGADGGRVPFTNLELVFDGVRPGRPFLVGAHYDTRPYADEEFDPRLHSRPIPGANDGGSGTAVLLGLARYLAAHRPASPVRLVFFDGEDFGSKATGEAFIGSKHYASRLKMTNVKEWPAYVLVVDMVGDEKLEIFKETHSLKSAPGLIKLIFDVAREKKLHQFHNQSRYSVFDDHTAFIPLKIPSALLIDFDYPHWHKMADTLDKCSPGSLYAVFTVVAETLGRIGEISRRGRR